MSLDATPVQFLVAASIAAAGNPSVASESREQLRIALRGYGDVLADMVLMRHPTEAMSAAMVKRHNEAYSELAQALRNAGPEAAAEA